MWAVIPIRWRETAATEVWSTAQFDAWFDPAIRFSLGHFLHQSTFGQIDLTHRVFTPVVMDNPAVVMPPQVPPRFQLRADRMPLVNVPHSLVTEAESPRWEDFSHYLFWYAQTTDTFGGGGLAVVGKYDGFDTIAHEMLHAVGFEHSVRGATHYGSPYDAMSAASYGSNIDMGVSPRFVRTSTVDRRLPEARDPAGLDHNAEVGPLLSPAHLMNHTYEPDLEHTGLFTQIPHRLTASTPLRLYAVDHAADVWPRVDGTVVAEQQSPGPNQDHVYLELRRGNLDGRRPETYDNNFRVTSDITDGSIPSAGVVVHQRRRLSDGTYLEFRGVLPLVDRGDLDFRILSVQHAFTVTLLQRGAHDEWVDLRLDPAPPQSTTGVNLEESSGVLADGASTRTEQLWTQPCFGADRGPHTLTLVLQRPVVTVTATSRGYETPGYVWTVDGTPLPAAVHPDGGFRGTGTLSLTVRAMLPDDEGRPFSKLIGIDLDWALDLNVLNLTCRPTRSRSDGGFAGDLVGNFSVVVEVVAAETNPGVVKNAFPDRAVTMGVGFTTLTLTWDGAYHRAQERCSRMLADVLRKRIPIDLDVIPDHLHWRWLQEQLEAVGRRDPRMLRRIVSDLTVTTGRDYLDIFTALRHR